MIVPRSRFSLSHWMALPAIAKLSICLLLVGLLPIILVSAFSLTHEAKASSLAQVVPPTKPPGDMPYQPQADDVTIPGSPISVIVRASGSYAVYRNGIQQFYGGNAEGDYLWVHPNGGSTTVWGPEWVPAGKQVNQYTPVSNTLSGNGSPGDPWVVTTVVYVGSTGLHLTQEVGYVNGQDYISNDWSIVNTESTFYTGMHLFHAADLFTEGNDYGYGYYDPSIGAIGGYDLNHTNYQIFMPEPGAPASHYEEIWWDVLWVNIGSVNGPGAGLGDSCSCNEYLDNMAGLEWIFNLDHDQTYEQQDTLSFTSAPPPTATPTPTATATPTVVCAAQSEWCTQISPNIGSGPNELRGVVAVAQNDAWAVGGHDITAQGGQPLIERWNGSVWTTVSPVPTIGILNGVAALTDKDVWAVSDEGIIKWNGTNWATSPALNGAKAVSAYSASTSYDVWAVGTINIQHFNGTSWSVSTPVPNGGVLNGVAAIDQSNVWAVGKIAANPLVMHYTSSWAAVPVPTPAGATDAYLNSVDYYSSSSIWSVGAYSLGGYYHTLVEYWDGTAWTIVPSSNASQSFNELFKVYVTAPGDVWAVGAYENAGFQPQSPDLVYPGLNTLLLHWDGESWNQIDSPNPGIGSQLLAVTGSTALGALEPSGEHVFNNWAVGSYTNGGTSPSQTLIEHITPPAAPSSTDSFYERSIDPNTHYNQGKIAAQGHQSGAIVLDYNTPKNHGSPTDPVYGTILKDTGYPATISEIEAAVDNFADGYHKYWQGWPDRITLVVGLNNFDHLPVGLAELTEGHAQAWANMVTRIIGHIGGYPEISVTAGIDAEQSWSTYDRVEPWVRGYMEYRLRFSALYNFGSIDQYPCSYPQHFPPPHDCGQHPPRWSDEDYYMLNGGIGGPLYPLPQIYTSSRSRWWYIVARRAYDNHDSFRMRFRGSAWGGIFNETQSWRLLWLELNDDPLTEQTPDWNTVFNNSILPTP